MQIDADRLRRDLEANAEFGALDDVAGRGRTNVTGSEANRRAREYVVDRMTEAGLEVRVDPVGNVLGLWVPEGVDPAREPVVSGSHLDSVVEGGMFDGPLGVYGALESVRAMQEADLSPSRPVGVVVFTEEEGERFGDALLGSAVVAGSIPVAEALSLTDDEGVTLEAALDEIGFCGDDHIDPADWDAFVELHIEQSARLEAADVSVGIVSTITGIVHGEATIEGSADHAGGTPMDSRTDALAAASELVLDLEDAAAELARTESEAAVGTVGRLDASPNRTPVIPGRVSLGVNVRDVEADRIETLLDRVHESLARLEAERGVETGFERGLDVPPVPMAERCREAAEAAAADAGIETMTLHSGGGHDAMNVAAATDAAMLFAPSVDGISHSPHEWTDWTDCAAATQVLCGTLARLSGAQ